MLTKGPKTDALFDAGGSTDETMVVTLPEQEANRITFEAEEFMVGSDKLCMLGDWGLDFEKIKTLEFIMGDKKEKKYVFKKV